MDKETVKAGLLIIGGIGLLVIPSIIEYRYKKKVKESQELNKKWWDDFNKAYAEVLNDLEAERIHDIKVKRLNELRRQGLI